MKSITILLEIKYPITDELHLRNILRAKKTKNSLRSLMEKEFRNVFLGAKSVKVISVRTKDERTPSE